MEFLSDGTPKSDNAIQPFASSADYRFVDVFATSLIDDQARDVAGRR